MFDMAWSELALIGVVALLVLGPKELPKAMRAVAKVMRQARKLAGEFQVHVNDLIREADLQDVRKTIESVKDEYAEADKMFDPTGELRDLNSTISKTKQDIAGTLTPPPLEPETVDVAKAAPAEGNAAPPSADTTGKPPEPASAQPAPPAGTA